MIIDFQLSAIILNSIARNKAIALDKYGNYECRFHAIVNSAI